MTREALFESLGYDEFAGWQAYDRVFGLGDNLELLGVLGSMIGSALGKKAVEPGDVVPYFKAGRAAKAQTPEEMIAMFNASPRVKKG